MNKSVFNNTWIIHGPRRDPCPLCRPLFCLEEKKYLVCKIFSVRCLLYLHPSRSSSRHGTSFYSVSSLYTSLNFKTDPTGLFSSELPLYIRFRILPTHYNLLSGRLSFTDPNFRSPMDVTGSPSLHRSH